MRPISPAGNGERERRFRMRRMGGCYQNLQEGCEIKLTREGGLDSIGQLAKKIGRIAQLGERCPYKAEVTGSIPVPPTRNNLVREIGQVIESSTNI